MKKIAMTLIILLVATSVFASFNDTQNHWAAEAIKWATEQKIMNGYPDGAFKPDGLITRAEALKTIASLYDINGEPVSFADVTEGDWHYQYITYSSYVMPEIKDNKFYPDEQITRQDAIYAIVKAGSNDVTSANTEALSYFYDSYLIADYAKVCLAYAKENGIISGYENNTIRPASPLTRAEFATMLKNAHDNAKETETPTEQPKEETEQKEYISNFIPVLSVGSAENENGMTITKITGLKLGKEISLSSTESYENNVESGDIVVPVINHKGLVKSCNIISTIENNTVKFDGEYMNKANTTTKKTRYYFGEIENIEKYKYVTLKKNAHSALSFDTEFVVDNNAEIYFYNTMLKSKNRLYEESLDVLSFEDGKAFVNNAEASAVYIVAREYDGEMAEVGVYIIK